MIEQPSRRDFLRQAGAVSIGFLGLQLAHSPAAFGQPITTTDGYGPLKHDPRGLLNLPDGFSYRTFSHWGDRMDDGLLVPALHDGMAAFAGVGGLTVLVRNHEINPGTTANQGAFGLSQERLANIRLDHLYDGLAPTGPALGGTTTLVYDTKRQELVRHHLSLGGTYRNCAGGPTPWGSWLTCEETVIRRGDQAGHDHGYVFEVPADPDAGLVKGVPLKGMGRFNHEAVAVDPASGVVYLTEDRSDGLLYRYIPNRPGTLADGGRLQALMVRDQPSLDTRHWPADDGGNPHHHVPLGNSLAVHWIDLEEIDAPRDDLRMRGFLHGAAKFARGEGMWYGRDAVYFACTNGGRAKLGQIWRYMPSPHEGQPGEDAQPGRLELFLESEQDGLLQYADNLTVAPWGDLIVCEDKGAPQQLVGVTPKGETYLFAENIGQSSEFAGATFSPDGSTLFVNLQAPGITLAITGPWRSS